MRSTTGLIRGWFHSLRGKVLLRLEQWTTADAIMTIMSMFEKKKTLRGKDHVSKFFQTAKAQKRQT